MHFPQGNLPMERFIWLRVHDMKNNGTDITKAYHNGYEITAIMFNGVDVGAFTPPTPDYQPWESYPDSPVLTADFPYQVVYTLENSTTRLLVSETQITRQNRSNNCYLKAGVGLHLFNKPAAVWVDISGYNEDVGWESKYQMYDAGPGDLIEANQDVFVYGGTTVFFAKTT